MMNDAYKDARDAQRDAETEWIASGADEARANEESGLEWYDREINFLRHQRDELLEALEDILLMVADEVVCPDIEWVAERDEVKTARRAIAKAKPARVAGRGRR